MSYELTDEQKRKDWERSKYWAQYDRATKKNAVQLNDYHVQQAYLRRREMNKRIKRFEDCNECYNFVTARMYEKTRCINYYVYFDHFAYVRLEWVFSIGMPYTAYFERSTTDMVTLTPYGLLWVLRYLLRKYGILIIRPLALKDLNLLEQKR